MLFFASTVSALLAVASAHGVYAPVAAGITGYATGYGMPALATTGFAAPAAVAVKTMTTAPAVAVAAAPAVAVASAPVAAAQHAVFNAAVHSNHIVKHYDVPSVGSVATTTIDVPANVLPVNFVFRSASSAINVQQMHQGSAGSFKETASQDEPHVLKHTVTKPIIQEVREVISPFRRITQTVEPVREEIQTLVAKGVGATQGAMYAATMGARPAVLAARPAMLAAPAAAVVAAPAPAVMAAPAAVAVARPAVAAFAAPAIATGPAIATLNARAAIATGPIGVATYNTGLRFDAGKIAHFSAPATGFLAAKKL